MVLAEEPESTYDVPAYPLWVFGFLLTVQDADSLRTKSISGSQTLIPMGAGTTQLIFILLALICLAALVVVAACASKFSHYATPLTIVILLLAATLLFFILAAVVDRRK